MGSISITLKKLTNNSNKIYIRYDKFKSTRIYLTRSNGYINLEFNSKDLDLIIFKNNIIGCNSKLDDIIFKIKKIHIDFNILEELTTTKLAKNLRKYIRTDNSIDILVKPISINDNIFVKNLNDIRKMKRSLSFHKSNIFITSNKNLNSFYNNTQLYINNFFFNLVKEKGMYNKYKTEIELLCDLDFYKSYPNIPNLRTILDYNINTSIDKYCNEYLKIKSEYDNILNDLHKDLINKVSFKQGDVITDGFQTIKIESIDLEMSVFKLKSITYIGTDVSKKGCDNDTLIIDNNPHYSNIKLLLND